MGPVLEVRDLTKIYRRRGQSTVTAVDGVSFSLQPGECLGIIGESGRKEGRSHVCVGEVSAVYMRRCRWSFSSRRIPLIPAAPWGTGLGRACVTAGGLPRLPGRKAESCWCSADFPLTLQGAILMRSAVDNVSAQQLPGHWRSGRPFFCATRQLPLWMSRSSRKYWICWEHCAGT